MAKNIVLLFLSTTRTSLNDGKVTVNEYKCESISGENVFTTNESAVRYILESVTVDKIFILASKMVKGNITCFDKDTKTAFEYFGDDGKPRTHLEYFTERIGKFLPDVDNKIITCDYNENSGNNQNLESVAKFAGEIQKHVAQVRQNQVDEEVTLHVDFSGGMRNVNMIMLDIIRLLEYSKIKIGKLLYSNLQGNIVKVEEVKDIYALLKLTAGVEEFVNFGTVKALQDYYSECKDNLSAPLEKLIDAMKNFSEQVKLCHYGQFKAAIENLHDAVRDFKADNNNVQDVLMERLIGRIRRDYEDLIKTREIFDDLEVINWCVNHGHIQQALTLYTERVPEYLGEHGFITQSDKQARKLDSQIAADNMRRNRWYYLLNVYDLYNKRLDDAKSKYCTALKDTAMLAIRKKNFNYDEWIKNLNAKLAKFDVECADEPRLRGQLELLKNLQFDAQLLSNLSNPELNPIRKIISKCSDKLKAEHVTGKRINILNKFIQYEINNDDFYKYFPKLNFAKSLTSKYPNTFKQLIMIEDKVFEVKISVESFLSIMDRYSRIKHERNQSNHARPDSSEFNTATELKNFIIEGIEELRNAKIIH